VSRLAFYRLWVPSALRNARLRISVWWLWSRRIARGVLLGRWPWETWAEIQEERRRVRAAVDRIFAPIEEAILRPLPSTPSSASAGDGPGKDGEA
jgi:hypothetical protein